MVFREHRLRALLLSIFVHLGFYVTRIVQPAQRFDHDAPKSTNSSETVNKMNTSVVATSTIAPSIKGIRIVRKQRKTLCLLYNDAQRYGLLQKRYS